MIPAGLDRARATEALVEVLRGETDAHTVARRIDPARADEIAGWLHDAAVTLVHAVEAQQFADVFGDGERAFGPVRKVIAAGPVRAD